VRRSSESGRSYSQPTLQQLPPRLPATRELAVDIAAAVYPPRPGRFFVAADYSALELRLAAHYSR
jgi:DNA polymerase I-like protein with 3'-5' exonuclease and polymerase domains